VLFADHAAVVSGICLATASLADLRFVSLLFLLRRPPGWLGVSARECELHLRAQ
jgi:hypothetical protein